MCDLCNASMNALPEPMKAVLEKYRGEMTALANRIGDDVSKQVIKIDPVPDADEEERKQLQTKIDSNMAFSSLAIAVAYAATASDHSQDAIEAFHRLFHQALVIGHWKSGQEDFSSTLN